MSGTIVVDEAQSGNHDTSCHKSQIPFNKHVYEKKNGQRTWVTKVTMFKQQLIPMQSKKSTYLKVVTRFLIFHAIIV